MSIIKNKRKHNNHKPKITFRSGEHLILGPAASSPTSIRSTNNIEDNGTWPTVFSEYPKQTMDITAVPIIITAADKKRERFDDQVIELETFTVH